MSDPTTTSTTPSRSNPISIRPDELPTTIRAFLVAHAAHDVEAAVAALTADAVVSDQGETFRGTEEIVGWMRRSASEFTYTSELVGAQRTGYEDWAATVHLVGDFPGGQADLRYRFTMCRELVSELHIGT